MHGFLSIEKVVQHKNPKKFFFLAKTLLLPPLTWVWRVVWWKSPWQWPWQPFQKGIPQKGPFFGGKVSTLRGYKMVKFWDFWPEIWYWPMILPLFLTFGKKIGAGLLLLNKPVPTCQIFEATRTGLAIYAIQNFSQNLMGRWVMSVQYEFDQFRKWNFWNGGQKTEKTLKNGIVLTLIIIFFLAS